MKSSMLKTAAAGLVLSGAFGAGATAFAATPAQAQTVTNTDTHVKTNPSDPLHAPKINFAGTQAKTAAVVAKPAAPPVQQAVAPTVLSKIPTTMFPQGVSNYNEVTHIKGFIGWLVGSLDSSAKVTRDPNNVSVYIHNAKYGDTTVTLKPAANDPNKVTFALDKTYTASISNVTPNSFTANLDGAGPVNFVMNANHQITITGVPNITAGGRSIGISSLVMNPS